MKKIKKIENEYVIDENIAMEVYKALFKKSKIWGVFLGVYNLIGFVIWWILMKKFSFVLLIIGIGCLGFAIFWPYLNSKKLLNLLKKLNNGKVKIVFEDDIKVIRGEKISFYNYNQIVSHVETDNTLTLVMGVNSMKILLIVLKNKFIKGNYEEFLKLLETNKIIINK